MKQKEFEQLCGEIISKKEKEAVSMLTEKDREYSEAFIKDLYEECISNNEEKTTCFNKTTVMKLASAVAILICVITLGIHFYINPMKKENTTSRSIQGQDQMVVAMIDIKDGSITYVNVNGGETGVTSNHYVAPMGKEVIGCQMQNALDEQTESSTTTQNK